MITYSRVSKANFNEIEFNLNGDGVSSVLVINLSRPPFNLNFNGSLPLAIELDTRDPTIIKSADAKLETINSETFLTITFDTPPPANVAVAPMLVIVYGSL